MARLILDTGALVALERTDAGQDEILGDDADVAVAAITAAELLVGVELADDTHRPGREVFVDGVLDRVQIIAFDLTIARHHGELLAHVRRTGPTTGRP